MAASISRLPVELIHAIALSFDTTDRRSARHIVQLGSTSHRLHSILHQVSHIWKVLYSEQYIYANPDSEVKRHAVRQEDYFLLFQDRRRLDTGLLSALDHLIDTDERAPLCRFVARHRQDIQDVLEYLARPIPFGDPSLARFISRRRWAAHSRVLVERLSAVDVFTSLGRDPDAVSFEDGLMALSQFEGISVKDVGTPSSRALSLCVKLTTCATTSYARPSRCCIRPARRICASDHSGSPGLLLLRILRLRYVPRCDARASCPPLQVE
jgi:hypothetical protein